MVVLSSFSSLIWKRNYCIFYMKWCWFESNLAMVMASSLRGRKRRRISIGARESFCGGSKYRKSNRMVEKGTPPRFYLAGRKNSTSTRWPVGSGWVRAASESCQMIRCDILTTVNLIVLTPQVRGQATAIRPDTTVAIRRHRISAII